MSAPNSNRSLFADVPESPEVLRRVIQDAVRYAQEGRASHAAWLQYIERAEACCDECREALPAELKVAGNADTQREWVRKYDVILRALTASLAPLMVEAIAKIADEEERKRSERFAHHALRYRQAAHRG